MNQPSLIFHATGTFQALWAAERFLKSAGFAFGPGSAGNQTAVMFGDYVVAKWHNLNRAERAGCHGLLTGNRREGPVTVTLTDRCPAEGRQRFIDAASDLEGIA